MIDKGRAAVVALGVCVLFQLAISAVELFFWMTPAVYKIFGFTGDGDAKKAWSIVMNAGLYNLFIAAGLIWGAVGDARSYPVRVFFSSCVIIAGLFGAATLPRTGLPIPSTLLIQTIPGIAALISSWAARPSARPLEIDAKTA